MKVYVRISRRLPIQAVVDNLNASLLMMTVSSRWTWQCLKNGQLGLLTEKE